MPYPRSKTFQRWKECDRCGLDYPINELRRDYSGAKVCPDCFDPKGFKENLANVSLTTEELDTDEYAEDIL